MGHFKECKNCGGVWDNRDDFLNDPSIFPLGFQPHFSDAEKSFVIFHHNLKNCQTTLAVSLIEFTDMMPGFLDGKSYLKSDGCHGHCLTDAYHVVCDHPVCRNKLVRKLVRDLMTAKGIDPANPIFGPTF